MERWDEGFNRLNSVLILGIVLFFVYITIAYFNGITNLSTAVELTHEKYAEVFITTENINLSIAIFIGCIFIVSFLSRFWNDSCERETGFLSGMSCIPMICLVPSLIPLSYWLAFTVLYTDKNYFLIMTILFIIYFIPPIMAEKRRHHNKMAISLLSLLLGWTVIGWFIALIWSATTSSKK